MNFLLRRLVDHRSEGAISTSLRRKRFKRFLTWISDLPRPVTILDVGGEQVFWELMGLADDPDYRITLLNLYKPETTCSNIKGVVGDATDLHEYPAGAFQVAFSNSVIEHLGSLARQERMAAEVQRVGVHYYLQTPNKYFPIEPHFLVPFFQFYPTGLQVALVRRLNLGWYRRIPDEQAAREHVCSHRLLSERELRALFPAGEIDREKFGGLVKSLAVYGITHAPGDQGI